jgi:hypothetical protein
MNLSFTLAPMVILATLVVGGCAGDEAADDSDQGASAVIGSRDKWCAAPNNDHQDCVPEGNAVWITKVLNVDAQLQSRLEKNTGRKLCYGKAVTSDAKANPKRRHEAYAVWLQGSYAYGAVAGGCYTTKTFTPNDVILLTDWGPELSLDKADSHYGLDKRWAAPLTDGSGGWSLRMVGQSGEDHARLSEFCSGASLNNCQVTVLNGKLTIKPL